MTDAINTAQQIAGCENNNQQMTVHTRWAQKTPPQIINEFPEYEPYVNCLINKLTQLSNNNQNVAQNIGLNNSVVMQSCISEFQQSRRAYCTAEIRNNPSAVSPSDDMVDAELQRNKDLIAAQTEARAQKILSDKEEELIAIQNKLIENLKNALSTIANKGLSDNPILAEIIQPKIQEIVDKITEKTAQFARERSAKNRDTLRNNVKAFTYPMKPLKPQPITPLAEDTPPAEPVIAPLPII